MNITEFYNDIQPEPRTMETALKMVEARRKTFLGFAAREQERGLIEPSVSFSTSQGQEMLRIMLFRVLEEVSESFEAIDKQHRQEEAIDALNYLMSALMLDPGFIQDQYMANLLIQAAEKSPMNSFVWSTGVLGEVTYAIAGRLGDTLRNRAWMEHTQQLYFEGFNAVVEVFIEVAAWLLNTFESWDEFYRMYMAKDAVLQFRLETKY